MQESSKQGQVLESASSLSLLARKEVEEKQNEASKQQEDFNWHPQQQPTTTTTRSLPENWPINVGYLAQYEFHPSIDPEILELLMGKNVKNKKKKKERKRKHQEPGQALLSLTVNNTIEEMRNEFSGFSVSLSQQQGLSSLSTPLSSSSLSATECLTSSTDLYRQQTRNISSALSTEKVQLFGAESGESDQAKDTVSDNDDDEKEEEKEEEEDKEEDPDLTKEIDCTQPLTPASRRALESQIRSLDALSCHYPIRHPRRRRHSPQHQYHGDHKVTNKKATDQDPSTCSPPPVFNPTQKNDQVVDSEDYQVRLITSPSTHPVLNSYGLFAKKTLRPNRILLDYVGQVLPDRIADPNSDHTLHFLQNLNLDASKTGNHARFVNDFRGIKSHQEGPNVAWDLYRDSKTGQVKMGCKILRRIEKDQEILCSYGKMYWKSRGVKVSGNEWEDGWDTQSDDGSASSASCLSSTSTSSSSSSSGSEDSDVPE